jgi:predicted nucleic acid-binding protein
VIVVDASVWVAAFVDSDRRHRVSRVWLDRQAGQQTLLVAPVLMLAEVAGTISMRTGNPQLGHRVVSTLLRFPRLRVVSVDAKLGREAADVAANLGISGQEAVFVATARSLWVPLVTWDRELRRRAEKLVPAYEPSLTRVDVASERD